jgi:siroheme decarboxylase
VLSMTSKYSKIARCIQNDIESVSQPFKNMADSCGLTEKDFIIIIKKLYHEGYIRKFGAVLQHQEAGYKNNSLVLWSIAEAQIEKTGKIFSSFSFVSHCYERTPAFKNKYNLFTMLHSRDANIPILVDRMSFSAGVDNFLIMETIKEYKKTSPEYF